MLDKLKISILISLFMTIGLIDPSFSGPPIPDVKPPILKRDSLGPLKLNKETKISKKILGELFPYYAVSYDIGSGDSPDFHFFKVFDGDTLLFTIKSFIEYENYNKNIIKNPSDIRIGLLEIVSDKVIDEYGVRVGDKYRDAIAARGDNLKFGPAHHNVYLGEGSIFYGLLVPAPGINEPDRSPVGIKRSEVYEGNWPIYVISWPKPSW